MKSKLNIVLVNCSFNLPKNKNPLNMNMNMKNKKIEIKNE